MLGLMFSLFRFCVWVKVCGNLSRSYLFFLVFLCDNFVVIIYRKSVEDKILDEE